MDRAVIYARVSTEMQRDKHTIESQLSILPEVIVQKGYAEVLTPYIDNGISGETIDDRPSMLRLLEDAERGLFDTVFVIDIDRLTRARKSFDWEIIKDAFRKGKVRVATPSQEYDFEDEDQEFMSDLFSRISSYEKKKIVSRMTRGKREKARQGQYFGGRVLYGYQWNTDLKEFQVKPSEAGIVRLIFELCLKDYSLLRIAEHLDKLGVLPPTNAKGYKVNNKSKGWTSSTVGRILSNSAYSGEYVRWKYKSIGNKRAKLRADDEWLKAELPSIVSSEVFQAAQDGLKSRKTFSKRNSKREYLLSGLIYCEYCGCKMNGECSKSTHRETLYYACQNGRRKHLDKKCPIVSIRANMLEKSVWNRIRKLLQNPKLLRQSIIKSRKNDDTVQKTQGLIKLKQDKNSEKTRILDLYQQGKFDTEDLNSRIDKLNEEISYISEQTNFLLESQKVDNRMKTINELNNELEADISSFDFSKKRKILEILLHGSKDSGVYIKSKAEVEIRGLIDFEGLNDRNNNNNFSGIDSTIKKSLRSREM